MPHRIHKRTNTLHNCAIINNTYVYELKKNWLKYSRVNLLGPAPRHMKKINYGPAVSQMLRNTILSP